MIMPTLDKTHKRIKSAMSSHQKWDQGIANSLNHEKGIKEKDGLLYYDKRIYIPRDSDIRGEIISCYHDHITAGHPGIEKTKELILRDYWWPKLKRDVEAYIQGCETCVRTKASTQARQAPLHPNEVPSEPWTHISVDMITGLIPCKGLDTILVIVDCFSKAIIPIVACKTTLTSEGWAKILHDEVYAKYGMPVTVISDRGPQFVSKFLQDLYKMLDIKGNASTAFHPQTDGQTERINQEIEKYLRIFINFKQTDWPEWLPLAAFQYNNRIHSATAPTFTNQKHDPPPPPDIINDEEQYEIDIILDHKTHKTHGPNNPETGKRTTGTATDYLVAWKGYGKEENQWTKESELGYAKEAIAKYWKSRKDTITVQAIVVDKNKTDGRHTPTFILNSRMKDGNVQFQVQQGTDFVTTTWYFEHKIPHLSELIKDYYWASREEFGEEYGPVDGYAPEGEGG
ncbi:uncharacterized protein ARMOST_17704 [Armillaria ostoyae]|uniref:Integrase catalytic domain-containing protein n=1 Tax=Armillaria ostoyae TaxID=47428 RepID=A0A284RZQ4_ARMOS|nr:uncharacterized protein ARMOST_17704 [Armillaria ostoyae]